MTFMEELEMLAPFTVFGRAVGMPRAAFDAYAFREWTKKRAEEERIARTRRRGVRPEERRKP